MREYADVVLKSNEPPGLTVKKAMNIYKKFHFMSRQPDWGDIPFSCYCKVCFPNCVCEDTILLASLFNPKVRVPESWVSASFFTPSADANRGRNRAQVAPSHRGAHVQQEDYLFQGQVLERRAT